VEDQNPEQPGSPVGLHRNTGVFQRFLAQGNSPRTSRIRDDLPTYAICSIQPSEMDLIVSSRLNVCDGVGRMVAASFGRLPVHLTFQTQQESEVRSTAVVTAVHEKTVLNCRK
jgi:hypothetical protein